MQLADQEFGKPGSVDVLFETDIFSLVLLHGQQFSPPAGTPSALKTNFGWVLTGTIHPNESRSGKQGPKLFYFYLTTEEYLLKRFWEVEDYHCKEAAYFVDEQAVVGSSHGNTEETN